MEGTLELKETTEQPLSEELGPRPAHRREGGRQLRSCTHTHNSHSTELMGKSDLEPTGAQQALRQHGKVERGSFLGCVALGIVGTTSGKEHLFSDSESLWKASLRLRTRRARLSIGRAGPSLPQLRALPPRPGNEPESGGAYGREAFMGQAGPGPWACGGAAPR